MTWILLPIRSSDGAIPNWTDLHGTSRNCMLPWEMWIQHPFSICHCVHADVRVCWQKNTIVLSRQGGWARATSETWYQMGDRYQWVWVGDGSRGIQTGAKYKIRNDRSQDADRQQQSMISLSKTNT